MGKTDDYVEEKEAPIKALDETDIAFLKNYGLGPYAAPIKASIALSMSASGMITI